MLTRDGVKDSPIATGIIPTGKGPVGAVLEVPLGGDGGRVAVGR